MKCSRCQGPLTINNKGQLSCPTCDDIKKKITLFKKQYNALIYYKVVDSLNINVDEYLVPEEIDELITKGVEVKIK